MIFNRDSVQRFLFENIHIRGERAYVENSLNEALAAHCYPDVIRELLGQLVAAAILLSNTLKYSGLMTLQAKGSGAVSLLMVECTNKNSFRVLARWSGECSRSGVADLLGNGTLAITIDPDQGQRYQGVVPMDKPTLSECLEHYFSQSEQLPTRIWLSSDGVRASGLLLQVLPYKNNNGEEDVLLDRDECWIRITALTNTVSSLELLELDSESLLRRLYNREEVLVFDSEPVKFQCTCSRERSDVIIKSIGRKEADSVIREQGRIDMDCQFCNRQYSFDAKDIMRIFNSHGLRLH
ncbi:MAG: Hsp33 family molecular chaperone HslO [Candidatus Endonucleobacter bathymodioli]|uniref:33 kDa chaperonin n=1 Tax=Candidatus Endonucleibacter bathymodioli TaxID=539814 RepID=A0AA90NLN7_9GAMM|nr:Hsp33 family molecular chaperone HslO [Candidatus Endonucleobacter bathymodioli]